MNKVILMGRLTKDPEVRYGAGENSTAVASNGGQNNYSRPSAATSDAYGFMNIPDDIDDELPFS